MTHSSARTPDFFLLGAPKCGTTALSRYLDDHADVFISDPKEPTHFSTDLQASKYGSDASYAASCFADATDESAVGEASTWYLYSLEAVPQILAHNPDARFIVMLRQPAELFHSFYYHRYAAGLETQSPDEAWQQQKRRTRADVENPKRQLCGDFYLLGEQLERLYTQVSKERVLVLFYEDLRQHPEETYRRTLMFLRVDDDGRDSFPVVNASKAVSNEWKYRLLRVARRIKRRLRVRTDLGNSRFAQKYIYQQKPSLDPALRADITAFCAQDIELLSRLTDRDLTHWMQER